MTLLCKVIVDLRLACRTPLLCTSEISLCCRDFHFNKQVESYSFKSYLIRGEYGVCGCSGWFTEHVNVFSLYYFLEA